MPLPTRAQGFPVGVLNQTADVFTSADNFVVPVKSDLPCRLGHLNTSGAPTAQDRAELAQLRRLFWAEDYHMPEGAKVEIDGHKWNTVRGSFASVDAFSTPDLVRCCDVRPA